MNGILLTLIFTVVLGAAIYSRLPLTVVGMSSMIALLASMKPLGEPLASILGIVRIPAAAVTELGTAAFGISAPFTAGILLIGTLLADVALTNVLGLRR